MAAWMEERRGDMGLALEEPWVQPLGDLLQAGKWSVRTIVKDGMSVTKQAEAVWEALLTESTRMIATAGGEPPSALDLTLALQWALSPTTLFASPPIVTREGTVGMERTPGDHTPPPHTAAIVPVPPVPAGADPEQLPSQLARDDMLAQGASRVTDLLFVSVTLELGRPAVAKEIEGGEYASSLAICSGIVKATKSRGFRGFSEMLAQAKSDGDLGPSERHMEKLQSRLMTTSSPAFHMTTGSRLTQFWSRSKTVSEDGRVVAYYVLLIIDMYSCRGLPVLYDHELMRQAERAITMLDAKGVRAQGPKFKDLGGAAGMEGYPSSQGSSVSTTTSTKMDSPDLIACSPCEPGSETGSLAGTGTAVPGISPVPYGAQGLADTVQAMAISGAARPPQVERRPPAQHVRQQQHSGSSWPAWGARLLLSDGLCCVWRSVGGVRHRGAGPCGA